MLKGYRVLAGLVLVCSSGLASSNTSDSTIDYCQSLSASGNAEYPPYLWRSPDDPQQLIGAIDYLMEDLEQETGIRIDLRYNGPWGRVQKEVAAGRLDMIAGAFFTQARTEYMDYIYPEFQGTATSVWYNETKPFNYTQWSDLKPYRGVTVINNSFGQEFDEYARTDLYIGQVASLEQGLKMLSVKRVDYLIYEENPGKAYARQLEISGVTTHKVPVTRQNLYLTLAKSSPCNTKDVKQLFSDALTRFTTQDRMNFYLEKAAQLWAEQQKKK